MNDEFLNHAARAFFASAWADAADESEDSPIGAGCEIMDIMPDTVDPAATDAARTLMMDMERINGRTLADMLLEIEDTADGDRSATAEYFGHYAAMQAMGHGVGLHDAFGAEIYKKIKVPYIEFGSHSLSREYF